MAGKRRRAPATSCCTPTGDSGTCCNVVSVVQVDHRGQMVLPKEVRQKAGIRAGDKLAVVTMEREGKVCCVTLMKAEELSDMVMVRIGPVIEDAQKQETSGGS